MKIAATVKTAASHSIRARQLEGMFDVPSRPHQIRSWTLDAPVEDRDWRIGLIVGPSGCGKTTLLREFGTAAQLEWSDRSVIDDFDSQLSMKDVTDACSAVGFNTIPAWLRPFHTLSNGEQFRVTLARLIAEAQPGQTVVIDEFTSVVDRQVAKIASHALAKYARRRNVRVVVASCHFDIIDWLQPDWMIEPATESFSWREIEARPKSSAKSQPASIRNGGASLRFTI
jgi:ABC-type ATPase with predicted acetyltransferase domain